LTNAVTDVIVARVAAGDTLDAAARTAGVGSRTLRTRRRRAYSAAPEDRPHVEVEQRLHAARIAAAQSVEPPGKPWEVYAWQLEAEFPERWLVEPPRLDELLDYDA
jgi:hypothetical protein